MFCTHCGKEISDGGNFCHHCGGKIFNKEFSTANPATETVAPSQSMNEMCVEKYEKRNKKINLNIKISGPILVLIAMVSFLLHVLIGGVIGDGLSVLGLICLLLGIVNCIQELINKHKK